MLDLKFIRENQALIAEGARKKRIPFSVEELLKVDSELKPKQTAIENLLAERNRLSTQIAKATPEERDGLKAKVHELKGQIEKVEAECAPLRAELDRLLLLVPNPPRADVPEGKDDSENVEVRKVGNVPTFEGFTPKGHMELGEALGIIDVPRGVKIAGSRSYVLRGMGALLEQAILQLAYSHLCKKGYTPLAIPVLVKEDAMVGTGYFPNGRDQAYCVERDGMALVGTAEVSLTSYYRDEVLKGSDLPIRLMALSSCFRREAGTYGKDTHGLYRVHQFQKIEQVILAPADEKKSEEFHAELLQNAEDILQALELPYRVVYVCSGDLGQGQIRKHDIETWMPSRKNYSETHSCSTFHDFQARRLKLRYKDAEGKTLTAFTLNNTAIASPRILIPFLECHQQKDGSIYIPKALRPYLAGIEKIK